MINKRDQIRKLIKQADQSERSVLQTQFKVLRNKVNSKVRKDNIDFNNNRLEKANNENEVWKIVKDVSNPKSDNNCSIRNESGVLISDNEIVANLVGLRSCLS